MSCCGSRPRRNHAAPQEADGRRRRPPLPATSPSGGAAAATGVTGPLAPQRPQPEVPAADNATAATGTTGRYDASPIASDREQPGSPASGQGLPLEDDDEHRLQEISGWRLTLELISDELLAEQEAGVEQLAVLAERQRYADERLRQAEQRTQGLLATREKLLTQILQTEEEKAHQLSQVGADSPAEKARSKLQR
jgi:hypothetical protein